MDRNSIPKTEKGIRGLIKDYAKAGINLVHPEVIFNGYSAYPSEYLTHKDLWNGIDMLAFSPTSVTSRGSKCIHGCGSSERVIHPIREAY